MAGPKKKVLRQKGMTFLAYLSKMKTKQIKEHCK